MPATIEITVSGGTAREPDGVPIVKSGREISVVDHLGGTGSGVTDVNGQLILARDGGADWPSGGPYTLTLVALAGGESISSVTGVSASAPGYTYTANTGTLFAFGWIFRTAGLVTFYARNECANGVNGYPTHPVGVGLGVTGYLGSYALTTADAAPASPAAKATIYLYSIVSVDSLTYAGHVMTGGGQTNSAGTTDTGQDWSGTSYTFSPAITPGSGFINTFFEEVGGCGSGGGGFGTVPLLGVRHTRGYTGRLHTSRNVTGDLFTSRYTDALPPVVAASVTIDTGNPDGHQILTRASQVLDLVWGSAGAVHLKSSKDRGRTWGTTVTVISSGYRNPTADWDPQRQRLVVAMQNSSNTNWYVTIATLDSAGVLGAFSTPVQMVTGTGSFSASLKCDGDGKFTFVYVNASSAITVARCKNLSNTGAGTWA